MTHSSYELPRQPVQVAHLECGSRFDIYCIERPPKIIICPNCHIALRLVGYDKHNGRLAYRRNTS